MGNEQDLHEVIETMRGEMARLAGEVSRLQAEVDRLGTAAAPAAPGRRAADVSSAADGVTDRRNLLRMSGALAAGAVAGGAVLGSATPAAAANGSPLTLGVQTNTATSPTNSKYSGSASLCGFIFQDGTIDEGAVGYPATLAAVAFTEDRAGFFTSSQGDHALVARAEGTGNSGAVLSCAADAAHLIMNPWGAKPTERTNQYSAGSMLVDITGALWFCSTTGTPGTWRRIAGPSLVSGLRVLDAPVRAYDSRVGQNPVGVTKGPLAAGAERTIDLKVNAAVPDGAVVALVNLTATNTSAAGFLKIFKAGVAAPSASSINWDHAGSNIANNATVALNSAEQCTVRCGGGGASTDFIVDVVGYYL